MIHVTQSLPVNPPDHLRLNRSAVWDGLVLKANNARPFVPVVFTRIGGPVLGTIANEIEGEGDDLQLRFSFALVVGSLRSGSDQEKAYAQGMTGDYLRAVESTLGAMRRVASDERTSV